MKWLASNEPSLEKEVKRAESDESMHSARTVEVWRSECDASNVKLKLATQK